MALTAAQKKKEAPKEEVVKDDAPVAEAEAAPKDEAPAAEAPQKDKAPVAKSDKIKVMNPHKRFHYVHPASGTRLGAGEVKTLVRDPWLEQQVAAGVLQEV